MNDMAPVGFQSRGSKWVWVATAAIVAAGLVCTLFWQHGAPRREALSALVKFEQSLASNDAPAVLNAMVVPPALAGKTRQEQQQFLLNVLAEEVTAEGIKEIGARGEFGPLAQLFPKEATSWTQRAGVKLEDCVAFKLETAGLRAEVVLVNRSGRWVVVRCNNVKRLGPLAASK